MKSSRRRVPWVEKYRPRTLDDVVGNQSTVDSLRALVVDGTMPNLILSGPPGCGKTTSILCLARHLLGNDCKADDDGAASSFVNDNSRRAFVAETERRALRYYSNNVLELNASDERGVNIVREAIAKFAAKKATFNPAMPGKHKIVVLDEADSLTVAAQQNLRRLMEKHAATTRFVLACNDSTRLIEPIQSRCAILRYARINDAQMAERLRAVAAAESVQCSDDGIDALVFTADGDMRGGINNMQATHAGFDVVTETTVYQVCDTPHPKVLHDVVHHCLKQELDSALELLVDLLSHGYSPLDVIATLYRVVSAYHYDDMNDEQQLLMIAAVGQTHMRCLQGVSSKLQLSAMVARLCDV